MYVFSLRPKAKDSKNSLSCSSCCWIFRYIKSTSLSLLFLSLSLLPAYLYLLTNLSVYLPISLPTYQSLYLPTNLYLTTYQSLPTYQSQPTYQSLPTYLPTYVSLVWKEDSGKIRNWAAQSTFEKLFQMAFR